MRISSDSIKVLYVGRVSIEKNLSLLARIWGTASAAASHRGVHAELIIVGDGPYLTDMKAALIGTPTHFLGFRHGTELASIYASADLFVFPSRTDTLGQSVMEAQASGLPAIVSNTGGPSTIVKHDHTGLIVSGESDHDWTEALLTLILDEPRRARHSRAAIEDMQGRDIGDSFEQFVNLCERSTRIE